MYDYDKRAAFRRRSHSASHTSYEAALTGVQYAFVEAVGEGVHEHITFTHKRIRNHEPYANIQGFLSWDYGLPREIGHGSYSIRVWQKDSASYPRDIDPNILVTVSFKNGVAIDASTPHEQLWAKHLGLDVTPSFAALSIGGAWEKLLTGAVDYGD